MKIHKRYITIILLISLLGIGIILAQAEAAKPVIALQQANDTLQVNIGTIDAGQQVEFTYVVTIDDDLPITVNSISAQGLISGSNFDSIVTDDPATVDIQGDATTTLMRVRVQSLPDTGETPWWRTPAIIIGILGTVFTLGSIVLEKRKHQA
ncbi:MAG: hypothetical protein D6712_21845 [Chloroflexi bacterium]|nr:MAG: hypothetical protein D6712_21845 [Chloroflexota bacterium]